MNKRAAITVLLIVLFWSDPAYSQNPGANWNNSRKVNPWRGPEKYKVEYLTTKDGLSNNHVYSIVQNRQGFLWIGTENGLNRFDGYTFKVFKQDLLDTTSLLGNVIKKAIHEDKEGFLWIGTGNGLNKFDPRTERFLRFTSDRKNANSLWGNDVQSVVVDKFGIVWTASFWGGVTTLDPRRNLFRRYEHDPAKPHSLGKGLGIVVYEDREGVIWVGKWEGGLNRYDRQTDGFIRYNHDPRDPRSLADSSVWSIGEDKEGTLWVGTTTALNRFDRQSGTFTRFSFRSGPDSTAEPVLCTFEDSKGTMWCGTFGGGLIEFDKESGSYIFHKSTQKSGSIYNLGNKITTICEDRTGVLWVGTLGGIRKIQRRASFFKHHASMFLTTKKSEVDNILALREDRTGALWVGSGAGLATYTDTRVKHLSVLKGSPGELNPRTVTLIYEDQSGEMWVGSGEGTLSRFDRNSESFMHHRVVPKDHFESKGVRDIYEDSLGTFWLATGFGLIQFNKQTKTLESFRFSYLDPHSLSVNDVTSVADGGAGTIWVGTRNGGINKFDRNSRQFIHYRHDPADPKTISHDDIRCFLVDGTALWVGTGGGGLNRFDPMTGMAIRFGENDGLAGMVVNSILMDSIGNLWLGTDKGVSRFELETKTFTNFDEADDLLINEFSNASFKSRSGQMLFGGSGGFVSFYPTGKAINPIPPPIVVTEFYKSNQKVKFPVSSTRSVLISYDEQPISFEFGALDYASPGRNQYTYKLEGYDNAWIYSGKRRFASYTNLGPGTYVFRVKGSNSDGIWNNDGASLQITIAPMFWQTWWFTISLVVVIAVGVWVAYSYRVRKVVEMERLRLRISSDLHDELASNLTSIAMFGKILQEDTDLGQIQNGQRRRLLERIEMLSKGSVASIRDIIWALDTKTETMDSLLIRVRDMAVIDCRAQGVECIIDFPLSGRLPAKNLPPVVRQHLWLMFKEAIHNALKHSQCKVLTISVHYLDHILRVKIHDDGIGLNGASPVAGKGISSMNMRARELGGELKVTSALGQGTSITLVLQSIGETKRSAGTRWSLNALRRLSRYFGT